MLAISKKHLEVLQVLLQQEEIDVNVPDKEQRTPLIFAVQKAINSGGLQVVEELLKPPAIAPDLQDQAQKTARDYAQQAAHGDILKLFQEAAARPPDPGLSWQAILIGLGLLCWLFFASSQEEDLPADTHTPEHETDPSQVVLDMKVLSLPLISSNSLPIHLRGAPCLGGGRYDMGRKRSPGQRDDQAPRRAVKTCTPRKKRGAISPCKRPGKALVRPWPKAGLCLAWL